MKRPRLKKWAKWACTLAAVLAVGAAVFSRFYFCGCMLLSRDGATAWFIGERDGIVFAQQIDVTRLSGRSPTPGWSFGRAGRWHWGLKREYPGAPAASEWHPGILYARYPNGWDLGLSVAYPVLLTVIPAAFLWYADRRRFGLHACKICGYARAGLAPDAKCPECGTVPTPAPK